MDDKPKTQKEKSFKVQILAELEEARRLRKQQDLELQQKKEKQRNLHVRQQN